MKKSNKISFYLLSIGVLLVGIMLLLDVLGVFETKIREYWVGALCIACGLAFFVGGIVAKSKEFVFLPTVSTVIGLLLCLISLTDKGIGELWPMIPLALSLGILLVAVIRNKKKFWIAVGTCGTGGSVAFLVGTLLSLWNVVVPVVLIILGITLFIGIAKHKADDYEIPSISIEERAKELLKKEGERQK